MSSSAWRTSRLRASVALGIAALLSLGVLAPAHAAADLPCAVEGMSRGVKPGALCQALAQQLDRNVVLVHDAREATQGEAIQIITGDVSWTVVWLLDGHVRTWTRVSKTEPVAEQVKLLGRAARELSKQARALERSDEGCLRVDSSKARNPDLSYPWAELSPCTRKLVEVLDPWWLPGKGTAAP